MCEVPKKALGSTFCSQCVLKPTHTCNSIACNSVSTPFHVTLQMSSKSTHTRVFLANASQPLSVTWHSSYRVIGQVKITPCHWSNVCQVSAIASQVNTLLRWFATLLWTSAMFTMWHADERVVKILKFCTQHTLCLFLRFCCMRFPLNPFSEHHDIVCVEMRRYFNELFASETHII